MCADFGCSNYKEISTKESVDEVAEVFEAALRSGWLFREEEDRRRHDPHLVLSLTFNFTLAAT